MDFSYSARIEALRVQLSAFMEDRVVPRLADWRNDVARGNYPVPFMAELKAAARAAGLWNLFLPALCEQEPGTRLTNLEYAPLAEIMGRVPWASEVFNCSAPDTGNMELLHLFATPAQRQEWLVPLLDGRIRSAFGMNEPDVASSDATNIQTDIRRQGDDYIINGRKWYITNAAHPQCRLLIVMGKTDPAADRHRQQSMVLVPLNTPGVEVLRNISVMHHHAPYGHCEILLRHVRVPKTSLLGEEGQGFEMGQARLGPGRVHHCMRCIGEAELALELMVERSKERSAFGRRLYDHGVIADWIASSRLEIEQARLLVLKTAWLIDTVGVGLRGLGSRFRSSRRWCPPCSRTSLTVPCRPSARWEPVPTRRSPKSGRARERCASQTAPTRSISGPSPSSSSPRVVRAGARVPATVRTGAGE